LANTTKLPLRITTEDFLLGLIYTIFSTLVLLGLPAFLGSVLRGWAIRRLFVSYLTPPTRPSWLWLLGQVALVFEASVLALLLVYQLLFYQFKSEFDTAAKLFFGLSLPWLISSVVAAWWVLRNWPEQVREVEPHSKEFEIPEL
jgi:hypothetical protein